MAALDANGHPLSQISARKLEHLRLSLEASVQSTRSAGFERFAFVHNALPEQDLDQVDLSTTFLGRPLRQPFLISSMTGGAKSAGDINRRLALVAQTLGLAFGVGSQRAGLTHKDLRATYQVRQVAPDVLLFANLGAVQLNYGMRPEQCLEAVEMIGADALVLHLNPLQEALQPEGDHNFRGLLEKIAGVCAALPVPVIVKEVGSGISAEVARRLTSAGVAAIDIAGMGGTSFARVEAFRRERAEDVELALAFSEWGIPTARALRSVREAVPDLPIVASGGIRNGLDAAKALAMGASLVGFAHSVLVAAQDGEQPVRALLDGFAWQLRVAMFCAGAHDLQTLRTVAVLEETA
ncbi:MAG TPA: type 2 isopentenyl-diphosphate Delta-isomerase [Candidatus Limnocylindrales bacterium]|nr:type 2 isopentenyl-diphosphate Delta-isomerase [Candidatus Limnocylindrales bacterium]